MAIATGALLVLVTWAALGALVVALGAGPAALLRPRHLPLDLRAAIWLGVAILATVSVGVSVVGPVSHDRSWLFAAALAVISFGIAGARGTLSRGRSNPIPRRFLPLLAASAIAVTYLAVAALGPVTNYDSGLYHLGAVRYALEFGALPGLANLHFPLGYASSEFTLAALLSTGPWAADGFRLVNGFFIALACTDLWWRLRAGVRGPGTWVLAVGLGVLLVPMVALSDYWVTSPSQDSAVFALTVVAAAALADAVAGRRWMSSTAVIAATGISLLLLRPTTLPFVAASLAVAVWAGRRNRHGVARLIAVTGSLALFAGIMSVVRDRLLSGWAMYPLSVLPFDVPWRAADPTPFREATLGYHRDPDEIWGSVSGWAWVPGWIGRLPGQWEAWALALGVVTAGLLFAAVRRQRRSHTGLLLAVAPLAIAIAAWFLASPPSFRFAWGPVLMLPATVGGWSLWRLRDGEVRRFTPALLAGGIVAVTVFSAFARLDIGAIASQRSWGPFTFAVTEPPVAATTPAMSTGGVPLVVPIGSELCWASWPWCTPLPNPDVTLLGDDFSEGLRISD